MVSAGTESGKPARNAIMRAMLSPCSPSGKAQPMTTSSIWAGSRFDVRLSKAWIAVAAISSGRTVASPPRFALPTGVRTALTITASFIRISFVVTFERSNVTTLIPQRFSRLQNIPHARLRLLFTEQRQNRFALQIQYILLAHPLRTSDFATTHHISKFACHMMIILCDVLPFLEHPCTDAESGQCITTRRVDRVRCGRLVSRRDHMQHFLLFLSEQSRTIQHNTVLRIQNRHAARLFRAGGDLRLPNLQKDFLQRSERFGIIDAHQRIHEAAQHLLRTCTGRDEPHPEFNKPDICFSRSHHTRRMHRDFTPATECETCRRNDNRLR